MPLSLPNLLSRTRILLSGALLPMALADWRGWFWATLLVALATDTLDGRLARALGQATPAGARLDSLADSVLYLCAPLASIILYPSLWQEHRFAVLAVALGYAVPIGIGWLKFRRLTSYHTLAARAVSVVLPAGFILLVLTDTGWLLDAAALLLLLSAIEEIALTLLLPTWTPNVPSLWHLTERKVLPPKFPLDDGTLA